MNEELFDKKVKELADSYSEAPDMELWDRVEAGLDRNMKAVWRRRLAYWSAAAVVAAVLSVAALLHQTPRELSVDVLAEAPAPSAAISTEVPVHRSVPQMPGLRSVRNVTACAVPLTSGDVPSVKVRPSSVPDVSGLSETEETPLENNSPLPSIYDETVQNDYIAMHQGEEVSKSGRRRPSLSIAASGDLSPTNASGNVDFSQPSYTWGTGSAAQYSEIVPIYGIHHRFPVSAGLELKYSFLNDRLGVGLGVNYTFLISDYEALINTVGSSYRYQGKVDQSIHYIGVPLNFYVNILSGKKLSFYASVGGTMEKAVKASYEITDLYGTVYRKDMDTDGVQWSANVGLGLEYRFLDFLGIYVDPRLTYFFDCGQPYSVRTEQPFQFNLELGFRFHI